MAKKSRAGKIKVGPIEYSWYKEINQIKTNKKFIQDQIDSFMFLVEKQESIDFITYKDELKEFCRLIVAQGHFIKLDKEYQDKFLDINKFLKEKVKGRIDVW